MGKPAEGAAKLGRSPEVIERIKQAIAEAETIEEVTLLEKALKSGVLPDDLKLDSSKKEEADESKEVDGEPIAEPPSKQARTSVMTFKQIKEMQDAKAGNKADAIKVDD